jgi:hypothetical protein
LTNTAAFQQGCFVIVFVSQAAATLQSCDAVTREMLCHKAADPAEVNMANVGHPVTVYACVSCYGNFLFI